MIKILGIPQAAILDEWEKLSIDYNIGFEYNDFFYPDLVDDKDKCNQLIKKYSKFNNNYNTLHGAFFDVILNSYDSKIAKIAEQRIIESLDIATKLNCKKIVFHTNLDTNLKQNFYLDRWLKIQTAFYKNIAIKYPNIEIVLENMFDESPKMLYELVKAIDMPNVKVCLDIAHAFISKTKIEDWLELLKPYISHIHINDNDGIVDSHLAIGAGMIPYEKYISFLNENNITVLIEVNGIDKFISSYKNLIQRGLEYGK